jgi:hypothetical protein
MKQFIVFSFPLLILTSSCNAIVQKNVFAQSQGSLFVLEPCYPKALDKPLRLFNTKVGKDEYYAVIANPKNVRKPQSQPDNFFLFKKFGIGCINLQYQSGNAFSSVVPKGVGIDLKKQYWREEIKRSGGTKELQKILNQSSTEDGRLILYQEDFTAFKFLGIQYKGEVQKKSSPTMTKEEQNRERKIDEAYKNLGLERGKTTSP